MSTYMVERELPGISLGQLADAQKAAIATGKEFSKQGEPVEYIRSMYVPGRGQMHVPVRGGECGHRKAGERHRQNSLYPRSGGDGPLSLKAARSPRPIM
jgi:hypothetical protein